MTAANGDTTPEQPDSTLLAPPDLDSWWEAHRLLNHAKSESKGASDGRIDDLLSAHGSVKIRLKQAWWFGEQVLRLLAVPKGATEDRRRFFEAFFFFAMSALDCEAGYINRLCQLGLDEHDVYIRRISPECTGMWSGLAELLASHLGDSEHPTWFARFNAIRRLATHRGITPTGGFISIGSTPRKLPDINFIPEDLANPAQSFQHRADLGLGAVIENCCAGISGLVRDVETLLLDALKQGSATV